MRQLFFTVPKQVQGVMVKSFLRGYCKVSARLLTKLKRQKNGILVNGLSARTIDRLKGGDTVCISWKEENKALPPNNIFVPVVYEDDNIVVFDKPIGMPVYPTPGHDLDTLANAAAFYAHAHKEDWAFRPVYRLDRDTTGLLVVAKDAYIAADLAGKVQKYYYAVCEGELLRDGSIDKPIRVKEGHTIQREAGNGGERAVTHYQVLGAGNGHTLLKLWLETGRTHQIRVHMSSIGFPLAGDDMYGGGRQWIHRQALHCGKLMLVHPVTNVDLKVQCAFPKDMIDLLKHCNLEKYAQEIEKKSW